MLFIVLVALVSMWLSGYVRVFACFSVDEVNISVLYQGLTHDFRHNMIKGKINKTYFFNFPKPRLVMSTPKLLASERAFEVF